MAEFEGPSHHHGAIGGSEGSTGSGLGALGNGADAQQGEGQADRELTEHRARVLDGPFIGAPLWLVSGAGDCQETLCPSRGKAS